jgi:phosphate/sulfate permease
MEAHDVVLVLVVVAALAFDFTNGFHDTANAMATSIATRALKPEVAVGLAGLLNFDAVKVDGLVGQVIVPSVIAPVLALAVAATATLSLGSGVRRLDARSTLDVGGHPL